MPFPFSSKGVIAADTSASLSLSEAVAVIAEAIRYEKPSRMDISADTVTFTSGVFRFVSGQNLLVPISSGAVRCVQTPEGVVIHYRLSFVQMLLFVSLMVGLMFGFIARAPVPFLIVAWSWLFGGNYALTLYRFPRFLRSALSRTTKKTLE
jgi:hypothetical protein